jgi:hypothetical protein
MRVALYVLTIVALSVAPAALAQQPSDESGSSRSGSLERTAAAGPDAAAAPAADPHLAKAIEFMTVSGARELAAQRIDTMFPLIIQLAKAQSKEKDASFWSDFESAVGSELKSSAGELMTAEARIYASHFTDADLDGMIAFYKSDVGRKYLAERPKIVQESTVAGAAWGAKMGVEIAKRAMEKAARAHKENSSL